MMQDLREDFGFYLERGGSHSGPNSGAHWRPLVVVLGNYQPLFQRESDGVSIPVYHIPGTVPAQSHPHTSVTPQMCYGVAWERDRLQDTVHPDRNHPALANKKDTLPVDKQTSLTE